MLDRLRIPVHDPVFLNEGTSRSKLELDRLEAIRGKVSAADRDRLDQNIRMAQAGIVGEERIRYELMTSHYPLIVIHDLNLERGGVGAQIDYLVVTPYNTYVLECKNLVGNIEIDSRGAFVRTFGTGKNRRREGIYSPITQNERHIELIKAIVKSKHGRVIQFAQRFFLDDYYHSVVVLANEKTLLTANDAPEEICRQVIRADQLMGYIKKLDASLASKNGVESFDRMRERAESWLALNKPRRIDVAGRYELVPVDVQESVGLSAVVRPVTREPESSVARPVTAGQAAIVPSCPFCGAPMVLRTARHGKNRGNKFWGCSTYARTRCGGIISV